MTVRRRRVDNGTLAAIEQSVPRDHILCKIRGAAETGKWAGVVINAMSMGMRRIAGESGERTPSAANCTSLNLIRTVVSSAPAIEREF